MYQSTESNFYSEKCKKIGQVLNYLGGMTNQDYKFLIVQLDFPNKS